MTEKMTMPAERPVCTKEDPAPEGGHRAHSHPDAIMIYVESDHEDEQWRCPNCGYTWWKEGPDY